MLSELIILQTLIIISVFFLYWISDIFNTITLGTFYLLMVSLYAFYNDADVFVSFLLIIDLGVFFIMFAFMLHLTKFLVNKNSYNFEYRNLFHVSSLIVVGFFYTYVSNFSVDFDFNKKIENSWFFFISNYNYYEINSTFFLSEMHILKEIYFSFNSFEFLLISFGVYFAVMASYFLFNYLNKIAVKNKTIFYELLEKTKQSSTYFFRHQDFNRQSLTLPSTRTWTKLSY